MGTSYKVRCVIIFITRHSITIEPQYREKRFLRNRDLAELLHAFFTSLLFLKQFAFAGNIPTITLGRDVLA